MTEAKSSRRPIAALVTLVIALAVAAVGWYYVGVAADAGVSRIDRVDALREWCAEHYAGAQSAVDTMRVDRLALPDTIDPQSSARIARCGDLRDQMAPDKTPNPREMTGEEMPRGLR